jgi:hypothetical protein
MKLMADYDEIMHAYEAKKAEKLELARLQKQEEGEMQRMQNAEDAKTGLEKDIHDIKSTAVRSRHTAEAEAAKKAITETQPQRVQKAVELEQNRIENNNQMIGEKSSGSMTKTEGDRIYDQRVDAEQKATKEAINRVYGAQVINEVTKELQNMLDKEIIRVTGKTSDPN